MLCGLKTPRALLNILTRLNLFLNSSLRCFGVALTIISVNRPHLYYMSKELRSGAHLERCMNASFNRLMSGQMVVTFGIKQVRTSGNIWGNAKTSWWSSNLLMVTAIGAIHSKLLEWIVVRLSFFFSLRQNQLLKLRADVFSSNPPFSKLCVCHAFRASVWHV